MKIQKRLVELKYLNGPVDGILGPKTKSAIIDYQRFNRLSQIGEPSMSLLKRLNSPCTVIVEESDRYPSGGCKRPVELSNGMLSLPMN